jgi:hypothetical protein
MAPEEDKRIRHHCCEEVFNNGNLAVGDERGAGSRQEALAKKIFGLVLALATEPSKLGQALQVLARLQEQRELPEAFSSWAMGQLDARVRSMALEYAHDAEGLVQLLSFKGGTVDGLIQAIEALYQARADFSTGLCQSQTVAQESRTPGYLSLT